MILTIAGSGQSVFDYPHKVDIATKKRHADSDYVAVCHTHFWQHWPKKDKAKKLLVYFRHRCTCRKCGDCDAPVDFLADIDAWEQYWESFNPSYYKPSTGTCAIFCAVERWRPETIGLIGFDWVLDENPDWFHDAKTEKLAILSLVNIKDLRNDTHLRRIRPPRGVCLPHFLSERDRTRPGAGVVHPPA